VGHVAWRGVASLRREKASFEKIKRLEKEMEIAVRRGELIEKALVERQAAFLLTALRARCMSAPSAWSRRLLNISDAREMTERLRDMMASVLEDLSNLPEKVTKPDWIGDEGRGAFALGWRRSRRKSRRSARQSGGSETARTSSMAGMIPTTSLREKTRSRS